MGNGTEILKQDYKTPRWSNEILDCSMPMTFDTYSECSYRCLYCFAYYQKSHSLQDYLSGNPNIRCVNTEKIKNLFDGAFDNEAEKVSKAHFQFFPYIQARRIMQWGGLADAFDEWERRFGVTLELLKYFDSIDYPLSFSTKAAWWTKDERYMELFKRHTHNWHVKISIITADKVEARTIEKGCPSPQRRLEAIKRLADIGIHVTLRLRPYIIGVSDDWKDLILQAHEAGADSVTSEFFCLDWRANDELKARYSSISEVCGYDIFDFYIKHSKQNGYLRLNKRIKAPVFKQMRDYAHGLGMRFLVSDMYCREYNDACNCCGVPPEWGVSQRGNISEAILVAREKGFVRYSDIVELINKFFGKFSWGQAEGYNSNSTLRYAKRYYMTMADFIRNNWNNFKGATSPMLGYGNILIPCGVDENGDVIYKYNGSEQNDNKRNETI